MENNDNNASYNNFVKNLIEQHQDTHSYAEIMEMAVGGSFETVGILEREWLVQHGLKPDSYLIDVGCGSGRLAQQLSDYLTGSYLGIDIVPELIEYAGRSLARPNWRFEVANGLTIPEEDGQADMVCFFSVLTHLRHEASYLYLQEAARVLKPDGKIIFSYLEFYNPQHWPVFSDNVKNVATDQHLNQFIGADAIKIWAHHLGLEVVLLNRAGQITLTNETTLADGQRFNGVQYLGQSVCVLSKRRGAFWRRKVNNGIFRLANRLQRLQI